ncbi:MAG: histidine phosphatase family protein [Polyangiaceae bacterium]
MRVFLMRHSLAIQADHGLTDEQRYLSAPGRARATQMGQLLRARGVECDAIVTSPLVRAVQTAELVQAALKPDGSAPWVQVLPTLAPGYPPRLPAEELAAFGVSVLVVGHEPGISGLGAFLSSRPGFPPFRPGQICALERGQPEWLLNPESETFEPLLLA